MEAPSPWKSIVAGCTAGAIEVAITYPAEFAKTRTQLNRRLPSSQKLPWPQFGPQWYAGCTSAMTGNAGKVAVRFVTYERLKYAFSDHNGHLSTVGSAFAGLGAGCVESLLAVTPSESIKTSIIDDRNSGKPQMRGMFHATFRIIKYRGFRGLMQGFLPTTAKQAANSAVRFTSYSTIRQWVEFRLPKGEKPSSAATFMIGATAGVITVFVTQPLDTVKTMMQSIDAKQLYKNSIHAGIQTAKINGVRALWAGAVPRLIRLSMSGGIVFVAYEKIMELWDSMTARRQNPERLSKSGGEAL